MGELSETLTEVTARAGRAGRLPVVGAVRARGEQRRRRRRAGATTASVVALTGLAFGLLNTSVLTSAERAPQPPPAHSGPATPTPSPATTTTTTPPRPSPSATELGPSTATDDRTTEAVRRRQDTAAREKAKALQDAEAKLLEQKRLSSRTTSSTGQG